MMGEICFDLSRRVGAVKPIHGVNGGPECKVFTYDAKPWFREAAIPLCRLHDTEYPYGSGEFVDIPCIFRDFDADENDPSSYNFALTDLYIDRILSVGAEPIYRLGVSIEHAPVPRHTDPPKDFAKWARICEHIIRHYNEGWADGHRWNLRYWEIWNEADGGTPQAVWNGTPQQFFEFYCVAARHLKSCFPDLKIGGPALTRAWNPNGFTEGFFEYLKAQPDRVPMDFFSWHRYYSEIGKLREEIDRSAAVLEKYGYTDAENIVDEWNYMENWKNQGPSYRKLYRMHGAAFCAASLITMQQSPVDAACYFEADPVKEWCGLFKVDQMAIGRSCFATLKPRKPYYPFRTFGEMYRLGQEAASDVTGDGIYAMCASDGERSVGMAAVYGADPGTLTVTVRGAAAGSTLIVERLSKKEDLCPIVSSRITGDASLTFEAHRDEVFRFLIS